MASVLPNLPLFIYAYVRKEAALSALGRPAASVLRVFEHMQRNPIVSIPAAAQSIGISAPTVAKSLEHMRRLGMPREITGHQRHRLFVYDAYLAILSEGT
jgi:Fic family protein